MNKAYKFTFFRKSIVEEKFEVLADTLEEAQDQMLNGGYPDPTDTSWVDWYEDEFVADSEHPPEPQCKLYDMVKEYECAIS